MMVWKLCRILLDSNLKKAFTELQNVGIELGNILLPVVTKIAKGFSKFLNFFKGLDSSTKKTVVAIGLLAAALGPAISIVGSFSYCFWSFNELL